MQCAACRADFPSVLAQCPECHAPVAATTRDAEELLPVPSQMAAPAAKTTTPMAGASTLLEFPGKGRTKPQWRKELGERVREIQQRRALEAAREAGEELNTPLPAAAPSQDFTHEIMTPPLGLVPSADAPQLNPIVVAALKRIERARQQPLPPVGRGGKRGAAAAAVVARVEEIYQPAHAPLPTTEEQTLESPVLAPPLIEAESVPTKSLVPPEQNVDGTDVVRTPTLVVVPPSPSETTMPEASAVVPPVTDFSVATPCEVPLKKPAPRHVPNVVLDDNYLARLEAETVATHLSPAHKGAAEVEDRAPLGRRAVAGLADLLLVGLLASPAVWLIGMTGGNWSDVRVIASLAGIVFTLIFLYLTIATAATGRSVGQWFLSLRTVDVCNGLIPTTGQCARRAFVFAVSLALAGLGFLLAFIDAEGRALHDYFSGTITVRD